MPPCRPFACRSGVWAPWALPAAPGRLRRRSSLPPRRLISYALEYLRDLWPHPAFDHALDGRSEPSGFLLFDHLRETFQPYAYLLAGDLALVSHVLISSHSFVTSLMASAVPISRPLNVSMSH